MGVKIQMKQARSNFRESPAKKEDLHKSPFEFTTEKENGSRKVCPRMLSPWGETWMLSTMLVRRMGGVHLSSRCCLQQGGEEWGGHSGGEVGCSGHNYCERKLNIFKENNWAHAFIL